MAAFSCGPDLIPTRDGLDIAGIGPTVPIGPTTFPAEWAFHQAASAMKRVKIVHYSGRLKRLRVVVPPLPEEPSQLIEGTDPRVEMVRDKALLPPQLARPQGDQQERTWGERRALPQLSSANVLVVGLGGVGRAVADKWSAGVVRFPATR